MNHTAHPPARAATRAGTDTETFSLSCLGARVDVTSTVAGLRSAATRAFSPMFAVGPRGGDAPVRLRLRTRTALPAPSDSVPRLRLDHDGPWLYVLDRTSDTTVVLKCADDPRQATLLITATPRTGDVLVETGPHQDGHTALLRFLSFAVGAQLHAHGTPWLHCSGVARDDCAVLILGPSGSGKSTLAFLAATRAGYDFLSDDTMLLDEDDPHGSIRAVGWPRRVGIGVSALAGHPALRRLESATLRRHAGPLGKLDTRDSRPWTREGRSRIFLDPHELTSLTGARITAGARPAALVLAEAVRDLEGWSVEPVAQPDLWRAEPLITGARQRHVVDYLGLLPRSGPPPAPRLGLLDRIAQLPCVRVRYGPQVNERFPEFWAEVTGRAGFPSGKARAAGAPGADR